MPWSTPQLRDVRQIVRDDITAAVSGISMVGNSVLRVMSDATAGLCHLTLRYVDWLALQLLPDRAEHEWLDRHGNIWLVNADSSIGRKDSATSAGAVTMTGVSGIIVPVATQLTDNVITFETTQAATLSSVPVPVNIAAIDPGAAGNHPVGDVLNFVTVLAGVDGTAIVSTELVGGADAETDDQLRQRVLRRIQQPPMGGAVYDYEAWALAVNAVTRAWAAPEQGTGTITVRFLMDDLRVDDDGWPTSGDIQTVSDYIDTKRPVAVKDCYVLAPIKQLIDVTIANLVPSNTEVQAEIEQSVRAMLFEKAAPGQTIYSTWVNYAIMSAPSVESFNLITTSDYVMSAPGYMAVLNTISYE